MKRGRSIVVAIAVVAWSLGRVLAQDPLAVAPEMYRLLFENERVRVMEVTFEPGQKIAPHSHPEHYVYVAEGGTLRVFQPDGTHSDATVKAGDVVWFNAGTHWGENIGSTTVRLIVNELKEPAAVAAAAPVAP